AQGGAGEELDVLEVEQDLAAAELVHELEQLLADDLDVLLVEDLLVDEVDDGDVADVFDFQPAAARLRSHERGPRRGAARVPGGRPGGGRRRESVPRRRSRID